MTVFRPNSQVFEGKSTSDKVLIGETHLLCDLEIFRACSEILGVTLEIFRWFWLYYMFDSLSKSY